MDSGYILLDVEDGLTNDVVHWSISVCTHLCLKVNSWIYLFDSWAHLSLLILETLISKHSSWNTHLEILTLISKNPVLRASASAWWGRYALEHVNIVRVSPLLSSSLHLFGHCWTVAFTFVAIIEGPRNMFEEEQNYICRILTWWKHYYSKTQTQGINFFVAKLTNNNIFFPILRVYQYNL